SPHRGRGCSPERPSRVFGQNRRRERQIRVAQNRQRGSVRADPLRVRIILLVSAHNQARKISATSETVSGVIRLSSGAPSSSARTVGGREHSNVLRQETLAGELAIIDRQRREPVACQDLVSVRLSE